MTSDNENPIVIHKSMAMLRGASTTETVRSAGQLAGLVFRLAFIVNLRTKEVIF